MAYLEWRDEFSVGVPSIDAQHAGLINMLNDVYDEYRGDKPAGTLADVLARMGRYAEEHFATEELYFERFGYPDTESHKREHQVFRDEFKYLLARSDDHAPGFDLEVFQFLRDWIEQHILRKDRKYAAFLQEHGAE